MTTQTQAGLTSDSSAGLDLTSKIERLEQERDLLQSALSLATQTINELTCEKHKNKEEHFRKHWEMVYAGQAMQGLLASLTEDQSFDAETVAKSSLKLAQMLVKVMFAKVETKPSDMALSALMS